MIGMNCTVKALLIIGLVTTAACVARDNHVPEFLVPSEQDIFSHVATIVEQGIRRPGYPADVWIESYIKEQFKT